MITAVPYAARLLAGLVLVVACLAAAPARAEVLATIDGQPVTEDDLPDEARAQILDLTSKVYEARRAGVDAAVARKLLALEAARLGITIDQLIQTKVASQVRPVTPEEARAFYEANRARITQSFDDIRGRIEDYLRQVHRKEAQDRYVAELRRQHKVEVALKPPRIALPAGGFERGPADAAVSLVEFSDYQCPFCRQAQAVIARLKQEYSDRLRHVFRDFPIDAIHPQARGAHVAAACADQQGKFWEYHDRLFGGPEKVAAADLLEHARALGLDLDRFRACLAVPEMRARIDREIAVGRAAGVTSTPTFFINGRRLTGAQPYEAFRAVIEEELEAKR
jgi:predicted DsbA family dithiol-disulfide isomerase